MSKRFENRNQTKSSLQDDNLKSQQTVVKSCSKQAAQEKVISYIKPLSGRVTLQNYYMLFKTFFHIMPRASRRLKWPVFRYLAEVYVWKILS